MITSPRSKYMISGYQPGRADNQRAGKTLSHMQTLGYRVRYIEIITWLLSYQAPYHPEESVSYSCRIDPNYVEISTKRVKDVFDDGHFDFVTSALSMTFQGTWALILALIRISACISARKLKCSPKRRFAGFINKHLAISHWANYNVSG